jgi:hypothetical protein
MRSLRALFSPTLRACAALAVLGQTLGPAALAVGGSGHCAGGHQHTVQAGTRAHGAAVRAPASLPAGCAHCPAPECAVLVQCAGTGTAAVSASMPVVAPGDAARPAALEAGAGFRSLALTPPTPPPLLTS